jgi:transposase-like protein
MTALHLIRKACPACGNPMAAVPDDLAEGRQRYVCANCDDDPLHDR